MRFTILYIQMCDSPACAGEGCPIRRSPDQSLLGGSPRLIAACYVLHRLLKSRHPPCACVTAFHCCPRNFVPCETNIFRTYGCRSGSFYPTGVASPTLSLSLIPLCFRIPKEKQETELSRCPPCAETKIFETKTRHFSANDTYENDEKKRGEEVFPLAQ